ncbi:MAG: hypothetical protein ACREPR_07730, partial [Brasilonema sp.]
MFGPFGIGIIITYLLKGEEIIEQIMALFRIVKWENILYLFLILFILFICFSLAPTFFAIHWIMITLFHELHAKVIAYLIVSEIEEETVIPNQGIIRSTLNAGITGIIFGSIYTVIIVTVTTIVNSEKNSHILGITFGLAFGFCFGILFGGGIT